MKTRPLIRRCAAAAALAVLAWPVQAADDPSPPAKAADKLGAVRTQIAAKNFAGAIDALKKINDTGSADWNNLMGYSLRKNTPPDVAGAEKFYDSALRIDPKHRGALEYSGELYLMTDRLPQAEQRLATLDKVCSVPCEELGALKKAVARYKANGNKYVAEAW
ncbi:MAG TPA: tetratricopeptide repeat protein [Burkholderiaceae bacterium]